MSNGGNKEFVVLEVHNHNRMSSNDFLGEVRLTVEDLPYDREGMLRPPHIKTLA